MKTFSQIAKDFDNGVDTKKIWDIEAIDLVRIYKAHQRALEKIAMLEAKLALAEMKNVQRERAIYG